MSTKFAHDLAQRQLPTEAGDESIITEAELAELPDVVQRYMRFMGVSGRPRIWSFRGHFKMRFRLGLDADWSESEMWQYNTRVGGATRIFLMRMHVGGLVPMWAHDTYAHGHGHMLGKVLDWVPVVDSTGLAFDSGGPCRRAGRRCGCSSRGRPRSGRW